MNLKRILKYQGIFWKKEIFHTLYFFAIFQ